MAIATIDPASGLLVKEFEALSPAELDHKLERAAQAFATYRLTTLDERAALLRAAAAVLDREVESVAALMTLEMGKTYTAAKGEVAKCATVLRYYAEHGPSYLADVTGPDTSVGARRSYVTYQPLGPVLAVMPWNYPLWQAMRFAAPALMAGNVGLLKHASNVPQTALYMEQLFASAGFPADVFQTLLIGSATVETVLRDPRVAAATLTGSGPAGQSVAAIAGDVLKPTVLELGGNDPFVVMPSADLERAAAVAVTARCQNNGQSCIAAKRFIVHEAVADQFEQLFAAKLAALTVGDPMRAGTDVGPLATESGREEVEQIVADAVEHGARVLVGGTRPDGPGWFYPPTLITGITREMRLYREEVFGPVASLYRVPDAAAAISLANDSEFGLGSNIWTEDQDEQVRFVRDVQAGMVFINGMSTSYPELPFGGIKSSGFGRELSDLGMHAFMNAKTVWVGA
ncbi:NADP-dependent succinic semialdehyde dehydrogenase [Jatrophihabitans sp.]|uniref:NADP-dependent succinic semialdehyde dehydrogenase n=1 Tax=Jatrophihabitans sp. TaxID=1932789 RepID=UPI0030C75AC7|nr:gabD [Jatrophihabitans sp.]